MRRIIAILMFSASTALAQTHTLKGTNIVPSGSSMTYASGSTLDVTNATKVGFPGSVTPAALTGANDTNVTLTLGGTPTTALLQATSLTLGWTGTLAGGRGGTGNGFMQFSGPATSLKTKTLGNTTDTILELGGSYTPTGTWTSMTLVTPALGTPASGVMTNVTGTAASLTAGNATKLATTRAINGVNFDGSAAIVTPAIGGSGTIVQSNGSAWGASTPTWPTTAGPASYDVRSNGTNFTSYPENFFNANSADVTGFAADQYLTGSNVVLTAGDWKIGGQYSCWFDLTKTAAGTGTLVITVRMGTLGTTADTTLAQSVGTFGAGTAAVDSGIFDVRVTFRSVGSGTSAVVQVTTNFYHTAASGAGLFSTPAVGTGQMTFLNATSSGFNSSTPTNIGISINGGTSFAGTTKTVNARLVQP